MSERRLFRVNENLKYDNNRFADNNTFINGPRYDVDIPIYEEIMDKLPKPVWEGHEDAIACYYKAWKIGFGNIKKALPEAGFVSDFIDTAFNGFLFMWDSSFIVMFGKYASRIFNFQKTLDNMYSHQHKDGFICREICESRDGELWHRDDPASTGPNVMPWAEWEYFCSTGDIERLSKVFDPLCGYHLWLQRNRSWPDGSYWSCGLACGMDNQLRMPPEFNDRISHAFMSWIDACAQQYLSASLLIKMADVLDRRDEVKWLEEELELLKNTINNTMWSEEDAYYYDKRRDGSLTGVKTVGSYWTLLSDLVPEERLEAYISHLDNEEEFKRPNRVPSIAANDPGYEPPEGGYWRGGVWAPTNYMVLKGLEKHGYNKLAYEIASDYLGCVVKVFNEEDTLFENYSPEDAAPGHARRDFVGWTGLAPISIMFEYVFGIKADAQNKKITWHVNLTDRHGIENYPLGDATVDLICESRKSSDEEPKITVKSDKPITLEIICNGKKLRHKSIKENYYV